jgi:hypothetical protein
VPPFGQEATGGRDERQRQQERREDMRAGCNAVTRRPFRGKRKSTNDASPFEHTSIFGLSGSRFR